MLELETKGVLLTKRLAFQIFRETIQEKYPDGKCYLKRIQGQYVFFNMSFLKEFLQISFPPRNPSENDPSKEIPSPSFTILEREEDFSKKESGDKYSNL